MNREARTKQDIGARSRARHGHPSVWRSILVSKVKKPKAVVNEVKKVASPTSRKARWFGHV